MIDNPKSLDKITIALEVAISIVARKYSPPMLGAVIRQDMAKAGAERIMQMFRDNELVVKELSCPLCGDRLHVSGKVLNGARYTNYFCECGFPNIIDELKDE